MYDNYNYPNGADTPDAPWNEPVIPERDFDVSVEFVMRKVVKVTTNDYENEIDDANGHEHVDTTNTDWARAFENDGHFTIQDLLNELRDYVVADMETCSPNTCKGAHLKRLLAACDNWETIEQNFEY